jgi:hypothetical protein
MQCFTGIAGRVFQGGIMKKPMFLAAALCSSLVTGGVAFIALVLLRLKHRDEAEYIVLPAQEVEQPMERVLQLV